MHLCSGSCLSTREIDFSQFWSLEIQDQCASRSGSDEGVGTKWSSGTGKVGEGSRDHCQALSPPGPFLGNQWLPSFCWLCILWANKMSYKAQGQRQLKGSWSFWWLGMGGPEVATYLSTSPSVLGAPLNICRPLTAESQGAVTASATPLPSGSSLGINPIEAPTRGLGPPCPTPRGAHREDCSIHPRDKKAQEFVSCCGHDLQLRFLPNHSAFVA